MFLLTAAKPEAAIIQHDFACPPRTELDVPRVSVLPTNSLLGVLILQEYIHRVIKPANKDELVQEIQQFWATVDMQKCRRYIGHLSRVVPHIVELNGDATGF